MPANKLLTTSCDRICVFDNDMLLTDILPVSSQKILAHDIPSYAPAHARGLSMNWPINVLC